MEVQRLASAQGFRWQAPAQSWATAPRGVVFVHGSDVYLTLGDTGPLLCMSYLTQSWPADAVVLVKLLQTPGTVWYTADLRALWHVMCARSTSPVMLPPAIVDVAALVAGPVPTAQFVADIARVTEHVYTGAYDAVPTAAPAQAVLIARYCFEVAQAVAAPVATAHWSMQESIDTPTRARPAVDHEPMGLRIYVSQMVEWLRVHAPTCTTAETARRVLRNSCPMDRMLVPKAHRDKIILAASVAYAREAATPGVVRPKLAATRPLSVQLAPATDVACQDVAHAVSAPVRDVIAHIASVPSGLPSRNAAIRRYVANCTGGAVAWRACTPHEQQLIMDACRARYEELNPRAGELREQREAACDDM